jgi:hypothetical protein
MSYRDPRLGVLRRAFFFLMFRLVTGLYRDVLCFDFELPFLGSMGVSVCWLAIGQEKDGGSVQLHIDFYKLP